MSNENRDALLFSADDLHSAVESTAKSVLEMVRDDQTKFALLTAATALELHADSIEQNLKITCSSLELRQVIENVVGMIAGQARHLAKTLRDMRQPE